MKDTLTANKDLILLSKELTVLCPCELDLAWKDLSIGEPDLGGMHEVFKRLEFKSLLRDMPKPQARADIDISKRFGLKKMQALARSGGLVLFCDNQDVFVFNQEDECIYALKAEDIKVLLEDDSIPKISHGFKAQLAGLL